MSNNINEYINIANIWQAKSGRKKPETWEFRSWSCSGNWGSVRLSWNSLMTVCMACCMSIRFSVKGGIVQRRRGKWGKDGGYLSQTGRCDGRGRKREIRSVRWQNNTTSHWASLRLAPLWGRIIRQGAANDVLKVKPCAGLLGPGGPAAL